MTVEGRLRTERVYVRARFAESAFGHPEVKYRELDSFAELLVGYDRLLDLAVKSARDNSVSRYSPPYRVVSISYNSPLEIVIEYTSPFGPVGVMVVATHVADMVRVFHRDWSRNARARNKRRMVRDANLYAAQDEAIAVIRKAMKRTRKGKGPRKGDAKRIRLAAEALRALESIEIETKHE